MPHTGGIMRERFVHAKNSWCFDLLVAGALVLAADAIYAATPYRTSNIISSESDSLIVNHAHDWRRDSKDGYLVIRNKSVSKKAIFVPSPPLRNLWISDDSKYIVGLSDIKFDNLDQLIIWSFEGDVITRSSVDCKNAVFSDARCFEGSEGRIIWYDLDNPIKNLVVYANGIDILFNEAKPFGCYFGVDYVELNCNVKPKELKMHFPTN